MEVRSGPDVQIGCYSELGPRPTWRRVRVRISTNCQRASEGPAAWQAGCERLERQGLRDAPAAASGRAGRGRSEGAGSFTHTMAGTGSRREGPNSVSWEEATCWSDCSEDETYSS